jgi:hypothetical protein
MVEPHFTMFWNEQIPRLSFSDAAGRKTTVTVVAGALDGADPALPPPPESWASQANSDVAIWTLELEPGARWTMPRATGPETHRMLYFFVGKSMTVGGEAVNGHLAMHVDAQSDLELVNTGDISAELLLLQGKPIGEKVAQYGPFVMNTQEEIMQAMQDYRRTQFGGWPWKDNDPVHGAENRRFARYPGSDIDEQPPLAR